MKAMLENLPFRILKECFVSFFKYHHSCRPKILVWELGPNWRIYRKSVLTLESLDEGIRLYLMYLHACHSRTLHDASLQFCWLEPASGLVLVPLITIYIQVRWKKKVNSLGWEVDLRPVQFPSSRRVWSAIIV